MTIDDTVFEKDGVEYLSFVYWSAKISFDISPELADEKTQREIRKRVNKEYLRHWKLYDEFSDYIGKQKSDSEFFAFLSECNKHTDSEAEKSKQHFMRSVSDFSSDVADALYALTQTEVECESITKSGEELSVVFEEFDSRRKMLVFHLVRDIDIGAFDWFSFADCKISKEQIGYVLNFTGESEESCESVMLSIHFDDIKYKAEFYRVEFTDFIQSPWHTLSYLAHDLLDNIKARKGCNDKEAEIIPVLNELTLLHSFDWENKSRSEKVDFNLLKGYAAKHGLSHLLPLFDNAAKKLNNASDAYMSFYELCDELSDSKCEEMWRELYDLITDSQAEYIGKSEALRRAEFDELRANVEERFHSLGYSGEYPTFYKKGKMDKIHLAESYGMSYFVGKEKNVEYRVQCLEKIIGNELSITFLCGTALLKKHEKIRDIYSCCFNGGGRRLFKAFECNNQKIDSSVLVATKRAECIGLSKEERKEFPNCYSTEPFSRSTFITEFLFCGALFAILITLAIVVIVSAVAALVFDVGDIPEALSKIPWLLIFLISFIGFGGDMAITDYLASRK